MAGFRDTSGGEPASGDRLGPYVLQDVLGEGGMGIVFRAVHEPDGEVVALKLLKTKLSHDDTFVRRFEHEARAASEVRNRHLVPITDAGELGGRHFLAVRYVGGGSLADRIRLEGALPVDDAIGVLSGIATGLDALHAHGLVHRDVKPSNIMLDEHGEASLTDFGIARGRAYSTLTKTGQVVGTLDYLAPEVIRGTKATSASDIYALACVTFHALIGQPPFWQKSAFEVAFAHLEDEPPDPCELRRDLPESMSWAVRQGLAKDPGERPPTATTYANLVLIAARGTP